MSQQSNLEVLATELFNAYKILSAHSAQLVLVLNEKLAASAEKHSTLCTQVNSLQEKVDKLSAPVDLSAPVLVDPGLLV